ncbi:MAG TPA: LysM peptidoglycan-binding domain-containing protein [Nocardioides sp.]|nr:LysM peptidoglycan-binding domain-containing protein [Nocardioides sp.]
MIDLTLASRARCLLVWLAVTGAAALTIAWAAPDLRAAPSASSFDQLVVGAAAAALVACASWAWVVAGIVVGQALVGRPRATAPGVPHWLRAFVLLACGLVVVSGAAAQAADGGDGGRPDPREVLAGLPPPERVLGGLRPVPTAPEPTHRLHVVRTGDTLWDIAAADLGETAGDERVTAHWHRIHRLNHAVIGSDPDLIHPGQQLRMPTPQQDR